MLEIFHSLICKEENELPDDLFKELSEPITHTGIIQERYEKSLGSDSTIYCDMDGVLVDFASGAVAVLNDIFNRKFDHPAVKKSKSTKRILRKALAELGEDFRVTLNGGFVENKWVKMLMFSVIGLNPQEWFSGLSPLRDGTELLWPYLNRTGLPVVLLTAGVPARREGVTSEAGKNEWASIYLDPEYKQLIETRAAIKHEYATSPLGYANILIDDKKTTIDNWNALGGFGILHIPGDSEGTIRILEKILRKAR